MKKYFDNIKTLDELRKEYKRLVKVNHPDNGGSEETIKEINTQYEICFKRIEREDKTNSYKYDFESDELLRTIINAIVNLNVDIEICGSWIWVSGNTFSCKETLKQNGFKWASKKKMWYWHNPEEVIKGNGKTTMADIRTKYGSQVVKESDKMFCIA